MNRKIIPVSHAQLTSLDLEAFVRQANALNQRNRERFTSPFPKCPSRWISHYQFQPRPITFTDQGAVEGGLSWLVGTTLDFSFARDLCAALMALEGEPATTPPASCFWRSRPKSMATPTMPVSVAIWNKSKRVAATVTWPASTRRSPARIASVTSENAWVTRS